MFSTDYHTVLHIKADIISHTLFLFTLIFQTHETYPLFYLLGYFSFIYNEVATIFQNSALVTSWQHIHTFFIFLKAESDLDLYFKRFLSPFFKHSSLLFSISPHPGCLFVFLPFSTLCKFTFPSHTSPVCKQYSSGDCAGLTSLLYLQKQLPISRS